MQTGETNTTAHNEDAHSASRHAETVLPMSGTSNLRCAMKSLGSVDARGLSVRLELCDEGGTLLEGFSTLMLLVTTTDITVWIVSALLALGIGAGKYAKWKARNQLVRQLAAMDRERREKVLSRMNPTQAMEARQELMRRFNIF